MTQWQKSQPRGDEAGILRRLRIEHVVVNVVFAQLLDECGQVVFSLEELHEVHVEASTAIIYFLFCLLLSVILRRIAARIDIANRPRKIEGVDER